MYKCSENVTKESLLTTKNKHFSDNCPEFYQSACYVTSY